MKPFLPHAPSCLLAAAFTGRHLWASASWCPPPYSGFPTYSLLLLCAQTRCVGMEAAFRIMLRIWCIGQVCESLLSCPRKQGCCLLIYCSVPSLLMTWMLDLFGVLSPLFVSPFFLFSTFCPHSPFGIFSCGPTSKLLISSSAVSRPLSDRWNSYFLLLILFGPGNSVWYLYHIDLFIFMFACFLANIFLVFRMFPHFTVCVGLVWDLLLLSFSLVFPLAVTRVHCFPEHCLLCFVSGLFVGIFVGNHIWKANYRSSVKSKTRALFFWKRCACLCCVLGSTTCLGTSSSKPESHSHGITQARRQLPTQVLRFPASAS